MCELQSSPAVLLRPEEDVGVSCLRSSERMVAASGEPPKKSWISGLIPFKVLMLENVRKVFNIVKKKKNQTKAQFSSCFVRVKTDVVMLVLKPPPGRGPVYSPAASVSGILPQYRQLGEKGTPWMHV